VFSLSRLICTKHSGEKIRVIKINGDSPSFFGDDEYCAYCLFALEHTLCYQRFYPINSNSTSGVKEGIFVGQYQSECLSEREQALDKLISRWLQTAHTTTLTCKASTLPEESLIIW